MAPRASAADVSSRTIAAAPSPSTNPSRSRENGHEARSGATSRSDSAPIFWNAATTIGHIVASAETTSTRSARPLAIASNPAPSASRPAVHPVDKVSDQVPEPAPCARRAISVTRSNPNVPDGSVLPSRNADSSSTDAAIAVDVTTGKPARSARSRPASASASPIARSA